MSSNNSLEGVYNKLFDEKPLRILVYPEIRYAYKQSDYAYLLYRKLFPKTQFSIENLSGSNHWKLLFSHFSDKDTVVHYHWLECSGLISFFSILYRMTAIKFFLRTGKKVIWTIHNKMPPDCKLQWLNYRIRRWMAHHADILLVHNRSVISDYGEFFEISESKFRVVSYPKYPSLLMPRAAAVVSINHRFKVNIKMQDRLFLMLGHISSYKQIEQICDIFKEEPVHKKLVIAGPVKKGQLKLFKRLRRIARQSRNIILIPRFIKEEYVPEFMNAADYLLFNYRDVMATGGIALGKSYNKNLILPGKYSPQDLNGNQAFFFENQEELRKIIQDH